LIFNSFYRKPAFQLSKEFYYFISQQDNNFKLDILVCFLPAVWYNNARF